MFAQFVLPHPLARDGFVGGLTHAYDISDLPIEGVSNEEWQPLLKYAYKPEDKKHHAEMSTRREHDRKSMTEIESIPGAASLAETTLDHVNEPPPVYNPGAC